MPSHQTPTRPRGNTAPNLPKSEVPDISEVRIAQPASPPESAPAGPMTQLVADALKELGASDAAVSTIASTGVWTLNGCDIAFSHLEGGTQFASGLLLVLDSKVPIHDAGKEAVARVLRSAGALLPIFNAGLSASSNDTWCIHWFVPAEGASTKRLVDTVWSVRALVDVVLVNSSGDEA